MTSDSLWDWIDEARIKGAQRLLLKGNTPPIIESLQGRTLLTEQTVSETAVLSLAIQLLKLSGNDPDIRQFTNIYLKLQHKKRGAFRAEILCQQDKPVVILELSEANLPDTELSEEITAQLMAPGLHLIAGPHATLTIFKLVDLVAHSPTNHPILLSRGRPFATHNNSSHIEWPFDCPSPDKGIVLLPHIMPSHIGLCLPPSFLGHPIIIQLAHQLPIWQAIPSNTAHSALQTISTMSSDIHCGVLDSSGYHSPKVK